MARIAEKLVLNISNIPAVDADTLSPEEWAWLKVQHPEDYKAAQYAIKEHKKAWDAQEAADNKKPSASSGKKKASDKGNGGPVVTTAQGSEVKEVAATPDQIKAEEEEAAHGN